MKDYINRLARGCFEYEPPVMYISENHIEQTVSDDKDFYGEFAVSTTDGRSIKGTIYSDNSLVEPVETVFEGNRSIIHYKVNTKGMLKDGPLCGRFDIISSGGEQSVFYAFTRKKNHVLSSLGEIHNLFHFANLAQTEPEEAVRLFQSGSFERVFIRDDIRLKNIYRMLRQCRNVNSSMEEFLISIHKKAPVILGISANERSYEDLADNFQDSVVIARGTWGYTDISVSCDNECVLFETSHIEAELFAGNKYEFQYIIDVSRCHAGNNYAVISFDSVQQHLELRLSIHRASHVDEKKHEVKKETAELLNLYVDFRLRRLTMAVWLKKSLSAIEKIRSVEDSSILYRLFHAQLLMAAKKREEAGWLLEYSGTGIDIEDKDGEILYAYFLYLCSMYRQNRAYTREALEKVRKIYEEGGDCWQVLWVLMYLDDDYEKNKTLKLASIKEQFYKGCKSPIMYLEALLILNEQPVLLRVFDEFELQVIRFGVKKDALGEKLIEHIGQLADIRKSPSPYFTRLLKIIYERTESRLILSCICRNLIRNGEMGESSFVWYERAAEAGIRLTNLYEYYLMSCAGKTPAKLPKMVLMYFTYNSTLDYTVKAFLYASVISNKHEDDQTYENYRLQMKSFVIDQIIKSHINNNLAVVYREFLEPTMVKKEMAEGLFDILFTYRVVCRGRDITRVYVKHKEYDEAECYNLVEGEAFVRIYTEDAVLVFEDTAGIRYVQSVEYSMEQLFDVDGYIGKLWKLIPENMWLRLYMSEKSSRYGLPQGESMDNIKVIIADGNVSLQTRMSYIKDMVQYYYNEYDGYELEAEYITVDAGLLTPELRNMVIETYIVNGCFEKAIEIINSYGMEGLNPKRVLRICNYFLDKRGFDYDSDLLRLCTYAFRKGKYGSDVLEYLVRHFNGSTRAMLALWQAAEAFEIEKNSLDERLLTQMMFVHSYSGSFEKVFEDYYNSGARDRITEAYIGYNAYNYFVRDTVVSRDVFRVIEHRLLHGEEVIDIAKLALLLFYAEAPEEDFNRETAQELLDEMCGRDIVFGFYHKLKDRLELPFNVRCATVVEYVADPDTRVLIHYVHMGTGGNQEYMVEEMKMAYDGMFVRTFLLFYGESIQYYITEEKNGSVRHTESHTLVCEEMNPGQPEGRYEMINDILASRELNDDATFDRLLHGYCVADYIAGEVFKPL